MSNFDATTRGADPEHDERPPQQPVPPEVDTPIDALTALEAEVAAVTGPEPETVDVPGMGVRPVCSTNIESRDISKWQRRALPPALRKAAQVSPLAMDQSVFYTAVFLNTCDRIEVRRRDVADSEAENAWAAIETTDGDMLTFGSEALQRRFGVLDSTSMVKKLFPRDSDLVRCGQQVLDAAGWTQDQLGDLDGEDPTH